MEAALLIPCGEPIPQTRQAVLTALYRNIPLLRPSCWGTPTAAAVDTASRRGRTTLLAVLMDEKKELSYILVNFIKLEKRQLLIAVVSTTD